jgi:branched-chain amino acid transport system permease protein
MLYREAGNFKVDYRADQAVFPILQDKMFVVALLAVAYFVVPFITTDYIFLAILLPFLILSLGALGLNLLVGYCGQISLGAGGFMAVGAYSAYKLITFFPELNLILAWLFGGACAAVVGILFGIPSLRIKGFYLAVATLAAQFFLDWLFIRNRWWTNYSPSGSATAPPIDIFGWVVDRPFEKYLLALSFAVVFAVLAKNVVRGRIGRSWMAMRDMDIAAEIIGIRPFGAKLSAFAVSSFVIGVAGALWAFIYLGTWEPLAFDINRSFQLLFMVIIGGLGSILGSFLGAAFIVILPIALNQAPAALGFQLSTAMVSHLEFMIFGALIIFFLIVEPHGLARLWSIAKEKLRLWPFPH